MTFNDIKPKIHRISSKEILNCLFNYLDENKVDSSRFEAYLKHSIDEFESFEWPEDLPVYEDKKHKQFVRDMVKANLSNKIKHYNNKMGYIGPAIDAKELSTVFSQTDLPCRFTKIGVEYIVYPA